MSQALKQRIGDGWFNQLSPFFNSEYFTTLKDDLAKAKDKYPYPQKVFRAFELCKWEDVKVVIIGQDPYYNTVTTDRGVLPRATGLAFGVPNDSADIPPSLENIKSELEKEYDTILVDFDYSLESWAAQGVLLLNTALTVSPGFPTSHLNIWKPFTRYVIGRLNQYKPGLIWMLWGSYAKSYADKLSNTHHVLQSGHPSPMSANRGFWFGNNHFKKANTIINKQNGVFEEIEWYPNMNKPPF